MSRHAVSFLTIKALDSDQRIIEGWASRVEPDRSSDIVEPRGAKFKLPLPLLMDHDHRAAVGDVFEAQVSDAGIRFKAKIAKIAEPGAIKDLCDSAWAAAKAGLRRAVSVGFVPIEMEPLPGGGMRFKKWDWFELSMCTVPCAPGATIDQIKSLDRDLRAKRGHVLRLSPEDYRRAGVVPQRVVRLNEPLVGKSAAPRATPIADATLRTADEIERDLALYETIRKVGPVNYANVVHQAETAKAADAEFAALRARLAKLEVKR